MNEEIRKALAIKYADSVELQEDGLSERNWKLVYNGYLAGSHFTEAAHKAEVGALVEKIKELDYRIDKIIDVFEEDEFYCDTERIYTELTVLNTKQILAPYKQVPCKECGGSKFIMQQIGPGNPPTRNPCPHCTNGHVWEKK